MPAAKEIGGKNKKRIFTIAEVQQNKLNHKF